MDWQLIKYSQPSQEWDRDLEEQLLKVVFLFKQALVFQHPIPGEVSMGLEQFLGRQTLQHRKGSRELDRELGIPHHLPLSLNNK